MPIAGDTRILNAAIQMWEAGSGNVSMLLQE